MNEHVNPAGVHPPLGAYSHTVRVPPGAEWVVVAGQVGVDRHGRLARGIRAQAERAFRNVLAGLRAQGMGKADLVKLVVYVTDARFIDAYRAARRKVIGDDTVPASTLLVVEGLASPDMLIEVEAMAARARPA